MDGAQPGHKVIVIFNFHLNILCMCSFQFGHNFVMTVFLLQQSLVRRFFKPSSLICEINSMSFS